MALKRTYTNPQGPGMMSSSFRKRGKYIRRPAKVRAPNGFPRRLGISESNGGVPPLARTQLVYYTGNGYTAKTIAANTNTTYLFSVNSLFDPDTQVGGQQPVGFDQWSALYRHYRVVGCRAEVTLGQSSLTQIALNYGGAELLSFVFDAQNSCSLPQSKYSLAHTVGGNMAGNIRLVKYARPDSITGFDRTDDVLSAQNNTSPGAQCYWAVTVSNLDAVSPQTYSFTMRLTYFVEFFHPLTLTMS